eukprot:TRINITY_DN14047_c0_g1_i1.p1 TRINITY_DN14047_c0_g1~~TRINITY_DN14047_c0_g1_i1.p1  ORF type:complete len:232 (-),score=79.34 TRINITY_DN14047_c0_g1_i1:76-771(-)
MQSGGFNFSFPQTNINKDEAFVFLHGFAADAKTGGGAMIATTASMMLGIPIDQPDLNYPSFNEFTITNALTVVDRLYATKAASNPNVKLIIIGASMGGYIAARWTQLNPDKVKKLFLLCPAFEVAIHWNRLLKEEQMEEWRQTGHMTYQGQKLHYEFFNDASKNHPSIPEVNCPTHVIHGKQDQIVHIDGSRNFLEKHKEKGNVKLVEVEDDHFLMKSLPVLISCAKSFLM